MKITVAFSCLIVFCVLNQAVGWFGGGSRSSRGSSSVSRSSSSRGSGLRRSSSSSGLRRGPSSSGWRRSSPSRPATSRTSTSRHRISPKPKPAPKTKTSRRRWRTPKKTIVNRKSSKSKPAPKAKTSRGWWSNIKKKVVSWWSSPKKTVVNKPIPKPVQKPKQPVDKPIPKPVQKPKQLVDRPIPKPVQKPKQPVDKAISKPVQKPKQPVDMKAVIEQYEHDERKPRLKAYDAQPKNKKYHDTTIGIGYNLNRGDAKKTFEKVLPGVDFNKVKQGKQKITITQARKLFNNDIDNIYVPRAKNKIGTKTYDNLPSNVKTAVVNAVYRGDLGPKTAKLIKKGKWNKVKNEYLDHEQYKNADTLGIPGIKTRMDWNAEQFDSMIKPQN